MNRPRMSPERFLKNDNLPFLDEKEWKRFYAEFWVNTDVLNVRSGAGLGHDIISEVYFGDHILAMAKQGNWIAIRQQSEYLGRQYSAKWIHLDYLSSKRIQGQVESDVLRRKCSFKSLRRRSNIPFENQMNTYIPCKAVTDYLAKQQWLSSDHDYAKAYKSWRRVQPNPEEYARIC